MKQRQFDTYDELRCAICKKPIDSGDDVVTVMVLPFNSGKERTAHKRCLESLSDEYKCNL